MMFKDKIVSTILKYDLIKKNDKILIGLSGGADSVCLFHVLSEIREEFNLTIECAHINHMIRDEEATRDADFVKKLCDDCNIKIHILNEDVKKFAKKNGLTVEESGRIIRYNYFIKTAGADFKIATAHTKDDNAENVLMNLIKGNNPLGIAPKRENIIRPLIEVEKTEIFDYLQEKEYKTDSSNFSEIYLRNKVRISLIPLIKEKFNQNFTNTVYNTSDILLFENDYFDGIVNDFIKKNAEFNENSLVLSLKSMEKLHLAVKRRVVKKLYLSLNQGKSELSYKNITDVIVLLGKAQTGKKIVLPSRIFAEISYENLVFYKNSQKIGKYSYELCVNNSVIVPELGLEFILSEKELLISYKKLYKISCEKITIRSRENGDRVRIKSGHKNLSDLYTDNKIPRDVREKTPVILNDDKIIIIPDIYEHKETAVNNLFLYIGEAEKC